MKLVIQDVNGLIRNIHFNSAGQMRLAFGEITTLPNKWWTGEDDLGNKFGINTSNIVYIGEET